MKIEQFIKEAKRLIIHLTFVVCNVLKAVFINIIYVTSQL